MNRMKELIIKHEDFQPYRLFLLQQSTLAQKGKVHKHHIIPRYFDGADTLGNLITLSKANHIKAHKLLCKGLRNLGTYKDRKRMFAAVKLLEKMK